jgi:putative oxidoreductase
MKQVLFDSGTRETTASAGLALLRVGTGLMMLVGHGIPKIAAYGAIAPHFPKPGFLPEGLLSSPASLLITIAAEVVASAMLVLGLCTRPAAFVLGLVMTVAAFDIHGADPWFLKPGVPSAKEPALLYLVPMLVLILAGAGRYSVDAWIGARTGMNRLRIPK